MDRDLIKKRTAATIAFKKAVIEGPVADLQANVGLASVNKGELVDKQKGFFHYLLKHKTTGTGETPLDQRPQPGNGGAAGLRFEKLNFVINYVPGEPSAHNGAAAVGPAAADAAAAGAMPIMAPGLVGAGVDTPDATNDNMKSLQTQLGLADDFGRLPVHAAVGSGETDYAMNLITTVYDKELAKHAHPMLPDKQGRTLLHHAVANGHADIFESMLSSWVPSPNGLMLKLWWLVYDVNTCRVPIDAVTGQPLLEPTQDQLVTQNHPIVCDKGRSVLHAAVEAKPEAAVWMNVLQKLPVLIQFPDKNGELPLHRACACGNLEAVAYLHQQAPHLTFTAFDAKGRSVIHHACAAVPTDMIVIQTSRRPYDDDKRKLDLVRWLIALAQQMLSGGAADAMLLDTRDADGFTALHHACLSGSVQLAHYLIDICPKLKEFLPVGKSYE